MFALIIFHNEYNLFLRLAFAFHARKSAAIKIGHKLLMKHYQQLNIDQFERAGRRPFAMQGPLTGVRPDIKRAALSFSDSCLCKCTANAIRKCSHPDIQYAILFYLDLIRNRRATASDSLIRCFEEFEINGAPCPYSRFTIQLHDILGIQIWFWSKHCPQAFYCMSRERSTAQKGWKCRASFIELVFIICRLNFN